MLLLLKEALDKARKELIKINPESYYLEAEILLSITLGVDRANIYAVDSLDEIQEEKFKYLLKKRLQRTPMSYLQKEKYFYDLELYIEEGVLIPRPETELLLEKSFEVINERKINSVAEIGVGSGNIAVPLALRFPNIKIFACDISPYALKISKKNAKKYNVENKIEFFMGPYLYPILLRNISVDLIISNPPYVSSKEMVWVSEEVKKEPWDALYGGFDGCNFYREIFKEIGKLTKGILLLEISPFIWDRFQKIVSLYFKDYSLEVYKDFLEKERVVKIEWQNI